MKKISAFVNIAAALLASLLFIGTAAYGEASRAFPAASYTEVTDRKKVIPCGTPFGIKMLTDGVVVTDFGAVNGRLSQQSPAEAAGIRKGDIIKSVNGISITDSISVSEAVQEDPVCTINVLRGSEELTFTANALESASDGQYKLGMWTKDSVAGIGIMTYYDPDSGVFAGLGHGVSDTASGVRMPLLSGEITAVTVTDVIRGSAGSPGELCGAFISSVEIGTLTLNSDFGVFGHCETSPILSEPVEIAHRDEVTAGKAVIRTTTGGMMPEEYEIEIVSIDRSSTSPVRNMTVRITDETLLSRTGGIVQGMSGSPIIQNGRLVGAVTHVLVNDSCMGYAVFAENMLSAYSEAES
ncbi:MAG: SpoIVB peptidase [Ruminiclostridium sp.]|nr:SpoIVB peptidase [Ruminiclostridium sp.]